MPPAKPEWQHLATDYDVLLPKISEYRRSVAAMVAMVGDCASILELGMGTGFMSEMLLRNHPSVAFVGVDSSPAMLAVAKKRLKKFNNVRLILDDAASFDRLKDFEAVISRNVLFNLTRSEGIAHLHTAYHSLAAGGHLLLSSAHSQPDFDRVGNIVAADLMQNGCYEMHSKTLDQVLALNQRFKFTTYSPERIRTILSDFIGFDDVIDLRRDDYFGYNFLVRARKNKSLPLQLCVTDDASILNKGFSLRYHFIHDWYGGIPNDPNEIYMEPSDENGIACAALSGGRLCGFVNAVSVVRPLTITDKKSLALVLANHENVFLMDSLGVVEAFRGANLGSQLMAVLMDFLRSNGVTAVIAEGNPFGLHAIIKCGGAVIGKEMKSGAKDLYSSFYYNDLRSRESQAKINLLKEKAVKSYGEPSISISNSIKPAIGQISSLPQREEILNAILSLRIAPQHKKWKITPWVSQLIQNT